MKVTKINDNTFMLTFSNFEAKQLRRILGKERFIIQNYIRIAMIHVMTKDKIIKKEIDL